jgi:hypothetical protein
MRCVGITWQITAILRYQLPARAERKGFVGEQLKRLCGQGALLTLALEPIFVIDF